MMLMDCPQMMSGAGGPAMMLGVVGLVWLLIVALLVLGIAALVKYIRLGAK